MAAPAPAPAPVAAAAVAAPAVAPTVAPTVAPVATTPMSTVDAVSFLNEAQYYDYVNNLFDYYDTDKSGFLEPADIKYVLFGALASFGWPADNIIVSNDDVNAVLAKYDTEQDGKLSRTEFANYLRDYFAKRYEYLASHQQTHVNNMVNQALVNGYANQFQQYKSYLHETKQKKEQKKLHKKQEKIATKNYRLNATPAPAKPSFFQKLFGDKKPEEAKPVAQPAAAQPVAAQPPAQPAATPAATPTK